SERAFLLNQLGKLWLAGVTLDWQGFYSHEERRRVPLPTYPFERQRYWVDPVPLTQSSKSQQTQTGPNDDLARIADVGEWFFVPGWRQAPSPALYQTTDGLSASRRNWLVLSDCQGIGGQVRERLLQRGQQVSTVVPGTGFARLSEGMYSVRPDQRADYDALLQDLLKQGRLPESVVHMWTLAPEKETPEIEAALKEGYYSLLALTQALGDQDLEHCSITIVSNHTQEVLGSEHLCPEKATLAGPCRVIAQEYTSRSCRLLDIELPAVGSDQEEPLLAALLNELTVE